MTDSTNPYESPQSNASPPPAETRLQSKWRCHGARLVMWTLLIVVASRFVYVAWSDLGDEALASPRLPGLLIATVLLIAAILGAWYNWPWYAFGGVNGAIGETMVGFYNKSSDVRGYLCTVFAGVICCAIMGPLVEAVCAWIIRAASQPRDTQ